MNKNFQRSLGVQWGFNALATPALGNTTGLAFPNSAALTGAQGGTINGTPTAVNLPASAPNSGIGLQLGSVNGAFNLDVALTALETSGNGRVLSTPRVSTQNNVEAEIKQGTQIPIQTVANNTVTVSFKDAALVLKVTPQITAANTVIMKISLENGQADFSKAVNGIPPINTQSANTSVLVNDGQTTVIGGIYLSTEQYQTDRTPGLGRIPLLNWLFKRETAIDNSTRAVDLHHTADYEVTGSTMTRMRIITQNSDGCGPSGCDIVRLEAVRTGSSPDVSRRGQPAGHRGAADAGSASAILFSDVETIVTTGFDIVTGRACTADRSVRRRVHRQRIGDARAGEERCHDRGADLEQPGDDQSDPRPLSPRAERRRRERPLPDFDTFATVVVPPTGTATVGFELVRSRRKDVSPLLDLRNGGTVLGMTADVTFFGTDQVGNAVSVMGSIQIEFAELGRLGHLRRERGRQSPS